MKDRLCASDSNPGQQDGRHRRIHWAMAAPVNAFSVPIFCMGMSGWHQPNSSTKAQMRQFQQWRKEEVRFLFLSEKLLKLQSFT